MKMCSLQSKRLQHQTQLIYVRCKQYVSYKKKLSHLSCCIQWSHSESKTLGRDEPSCESEKNLKNTKYILDKVNLRDWSQSFDWFLLHLAVVPSFFCLLLSIYYYGKTKINTSWSILKSASDTMLRWLWLLAK